MSHFLVSSASLLSSPPSNLDNTLSKTRTHTYPKYAVSVVWSAVLAAAVYNALSSLHKIMQLRRACQAPPTDPEGSTVSGDETNTEKGLRTVPNGHVALRRAPKALLNAARIILFRRTSPPLFEVVIIIAYFLSMLLIESVNSRNTHGMFDPTYWANRAGTLAVSQLVLIVALSGKNNVISALTGITYKKLNVLHRAGARMILLLIWIHIWGRVDLGISGQHSLSYGWMRAGVLSAVALTLTAILGVRQLRNASYELFLAGHITLVFIFLVSGYFHVKIAADFLPYILAAILLWAIDRMLRFACMLRIRLLSIRIKEDDRVNATLELLSPDTLRVHLRLSRSGKFSLSWKAGQSAYLSIPVAPRLGISLEAHLFTIASIDGPKSDIGMHMENELCFIIRARSGFTRRLHELAVNKGGATNVSAFVDGPYGTPPDVSAFPTVVLISGGSGVSFTFPLLLDLWRHACLNEASTLCRQMLFVWIVREEGHVNWILKELAVVNEVKKNIKLETRIFVTGSSRPQIGLSENSNGVSLTPETDFRCWTPLSSSRGTLESTSDEHETPSKEIGKQTPMKLRDNVNVFFAYSRPNVENILRGVIYSSTEPIAVCASGPESLTDGIRKALGKSEIAGSMNVLCGGPSVFLHVEQFGM